LIFEFDGHYAELVMGTEVAIHVVEVKEFAPAISKMVPNGLCFSAMVSSM
jgi:2-polyprenyl-3-methyl-5-hydroxy-6-metoxy-1,4-benzoquinol methylase